MQKRVPLTSMQKRQFLFFFLNCPFWFHLSTKGILNFRFSAPLSTFHCMVQTRTKSSAGTFSKSQWFERVPLKRTACDWSCDVQSHMTNCTRENELGPHSHLSDVTLFFCVFIAWHLRAAGSHVPQMRQSSSWASCVVEICVLPHFSHVFVTQRNSPRCIFLGAFRGREGDEWGS